MTARTDVGTVDDLHTSATKLVGLDDFGTDDDNYREALDVLLDSYRREAGLTALGSKMNRFFLRGALAARLLSEAAWKQYPEHADVDIKRLIFVTRLVRTGTTALHRLLGADPAHQGLHLWLAEFPQPRPPRDTWESNPMYRELDAQFNKHHEENPGYTRLHFMAAYELVETVMASMCSLVEHTAHGWSTAFVGAQIGADAMDTWSRGLERFNFARANYDPAQFYDVDYCDLITDPMGTVANIYRHFGIGLTGEAREAMANIHAQSQTGARAPKHKYLLADYGLTAEAVKERFVGL